MLNDDITANISSLYKKILKFIRLKLELLGLNLAEKFARLVALIITMFLLLFVFLFFMIFLSILAGLVLSHFFDSYIIGFSILSAFYLIIFFILFIGRKKLIMFPVISAVLNALLESEKEIDKENEEDEYGS